MIKINPSACRLPQQRRPDPSRRPEQPASPGEAILRFSPRAWAKLLFFRDRRQTEVGGFGITPADDLLYVEDFITVRQRVSVASVAFEDAAVADFFDQQVDAGRSPSQFSRIWCHTHPGNGPQPSATDEETFARVFGRSQFAVMFILARGGNAYARLSFNVGPGGSMQLPLEVDFSRAFAGSDLEAWKAEYEANVQPEPFGRLMNDVLGGDDRLCLGLETAEDLAELEPAERAYVLEVFGGQDEYEPWPVEEEVEI